MANYPITLRLHYPYTILNSWKHYVYPWFGLGGNCYHDDWESNLTIAYDVTTFKYDIFPENLDAFLEWNTITANDPDGDQLTSDEETANGLSAWNYDSDGDGLNDKYEVESGLDGANADTDFDGVTDWYEHVYGTNATSKDTDQDGLDDFQEISGWVISFNYLGNLSLPFQIPVTSDPRNNDSDGDGFDDFEEYRFNTNPRSNDSDGDGTPDFGYAQTVSQAVYHASFDWTMPACFSSWDDWASEICVDKDGFLYAAGYIGGPNGNYTIRKYDASLQQVQFPPNSVFHNFSIAPHDPSTGVYDLEIDHTNEWLYVSEFRVEGGYLYRYDMNGTVTNPDSWPGTGVGTDIVIDSNGNVYRLWRNQWHIVAYDTSGTLLWTRGIPSSAQDAVDHPIEFALDEARGFFYMVEDTYATWGPRVIKQRFSDGAFLEEVISNDTFDLIRDIAVDDDGYVYVLAQDVNGSQVRRYSPLGEEDVAFRLYGNGTHDFMDSVANSSICLGPDKSIYISEQTVSGDPATFRIWKFNQSQIPLSDIAGTDIDWDNDTLSNVQEMVGWDITVNFPSGEETFRVTSSHLMKDTDHDGLGDYLEYTLGSNPRSSDTDLDGASDHKEWWLGQFPGVPYEPPLARPFMAPRAVFQTAMMWMAAGPSLTDWDTDGDFLGDSTELTFGSSPVNPDSDGEGLSDLNEFIYNSNPNSADSDGDGADDAYEFAMNSSLLNADSDGDLIFDGAEYDQGTSPTSSDQDGDGILDGIELYFGSDPMSNDSDGDGLLDSVEVSLWLDIMNNDTDGDGVLDGIEIAEGTDPWLTDSDWDGIVDSEDPDTLNPWGGQVALVYDEDASDEVIQFGELLGNYSYVTLFDADTFLDVDEDYQYVVLVGRPSATASGTAGLVYQLLEDTGSMLTTMMDTETDNIAVRYSVWTEPQTVVLMSGANTTDVFTVLQILKYFEVSLLPDSVLVEFNSFEVGHNTTVDYAYPVNTIDTVKATDVSLLIQLSGPATPTIQITKYNQTTTPHLLTVANGLEESDTALGSYIDVSVTISGTTADVFESALIMFYYRESDLDLTGNGLLGDVGDINESSLSLYHYDEISGQWVKLNNSLSWVIDMGQNTTNINVFGEDYAGYIWIQTTELSLFTIAGQTIHVGLGLTETIILIAILGAVGVVTIVFVNRWRKKRVEGKQIDLLSSLQGCLGMI
jgi:hypothetical protein